MIKTGRKQDLLLAIGHASRAMTALFDARLRSIGMTASRGRILLFLARHEQPVRQALVTQFLRVESATAVGIIDGLQALGYVERLPDPNDGRANLIALTAAGRPIAAKVVTVTAEVEEVLVSSIGTEDAESVSRVLAAILKNIATYSAVASLEDVTGELAA